MPSERDDSVANLVGGFLDGDLDVASRDRLMEEMQRGGVNIEALGRQVLARGALGVAATRPIDPDAVLARIDRASTRAHLAVVEGPPGRATVRPAVARRGAAAVFLGALGWAAAAATCVLWLRAREAPPGPDVANTGSPEIAVPPPREQIPLPPAPPTTQPAGFIFASSARLFVVPAHGPTQEARPGARLQDGDGLIAAAGSGRTTLLLRDGTRIDVNPDTVITRIDGGWTAGGSALLLARGMVQISRTRPSLGEVRVESPHGVASLGQGRMRVQVEDGGTRFTVSAGHAQAAGRGRAPPAEIVAGAHALVTSDGAITRGLRSTRRVVFVTGARNLHPADDKVRERLERLGFEVSVALPTSLDLTDAADSALIVVSSTVSPQDFDPQLRDLPAPLLTWEAGLYPILGMTARCEDGGCGFHIIAPYALEIRDASHPLAAGQSGIIPLPYNERICWGTPNASAAWVAAVAGHPTRAAIFAYERGAAMPGLVAPARRVGFFFFAATTENLPPDDVAWTLFDRAVTWSAE